MGGTASGSARRLRCRRCLYCSVYIPLSLSLVILPCLCPPLGRAHPLLLCSRRRLLAATFAAQAAALRAATPTACPRPA